MTRWIARGLVAAALLALSGCPNCAPDRVGEGVARLTVRNVGAMLSVVNADATCGFASADVLGNAVLQGEIGTDGKVVFTVTGCAIELPENTEIASDCGGVTTNASGKVTISATRTIAGILTGNPSNPVIPGGPDAVTIALTAVSFENFEVTKSNSDNKLRMVEGSITAVAKPRLAVAADSGACAIATPNVAFEDIVYGPSTVRVETPDNQFDADIEKSSFSAQNGKRPRVENEDARENFISGRITVFGSDVAVDGEEGSDAFQALDPDYTVAAFAESYACTPNLATPESFVCADLTPRLADGAARLTVKMAGTIAGILDANASCGFAAAAVQQSAILEGVPGGQGSLRLAVTDCEITLPETELAADCNGDRTILSGTIRVSGEKVVSGRVTGNPASPIVPISNQPASIGYVASLEGFRVSSSADENALFVREGQLAAVVQPRVFIGADTGVCSVSSPNATISGIAWTNADVELTSAAGTFQLDLEEASLSAVNGTIAADTNLLSGTMRIDGESYDVPSDERGLNPDFNQAAFDQAWQCSSALATPISDQCAGALTGTLAGGAAALTMRTFGTVVSLVDANQGCGFRSAAVGGTPTFAGGDVGDDDVTATFTLPAAGCTVALPADTVVATDCLGNTTTVSGSVTVRGTKEVTGFHTGDPLEAIVPTSFKPAVFSLTLTFDELVVESSTSTASLTVHGGTLAGVFSPRLALNPATGACSIATPNASFSAMTWTDGDVTLESNGSLFDLTLNTSALAAQNGTDGTATNSLTGSITVDGTAIGGIAAPLDPAYEQAAFDATYQCAANGDPLLVPDAACSFRQVLGNAAARLLVKAVGTATGVLDGNPVCGFADQTPDTAPVATPTGVPPAPGTLLQTADAACVSGFGADTVIATDCVGTRTHAAGAFSVDTATKLVAGLFTGADPPFVPVTRDAATLTLTDIAFTGWHVYDEAADNNVAAEVILQGGTASVVVRPVAGKNAGASALLGQDVFTEKTGVAGFEGLTMAAGVVTVVSSGKTFNLALTDVELEAFAGAFVGGGSNDIAGTLTVDGEVVTIAEGSPLVNPYDQATFDSTYSCNPTLGGDLVPVE
jgi:hypothetical protein